MSELLVIPDDLAGLPGAPFTQDEIDAAIEAVRAAAGWHIAPQRADVDVPLDVPLRDPVLRLPTRALVSVQEVRNATTGAVVPADRYRVSRALGRIRRRSGFWPCGYEAIEVDFTHGLEKWPADLLALVGQYVMAARRDPTMQSVRVDDGSVTYFPGGEVADVTRPGAVGALARYRLPQWPGMA